MDPALQALLTDQVTHQRSTGQDSYGTPTFSAPVTYPARIEYRIRRIVTAEGQERLSRAKVFLSSEVVVEVRDRLVLPDGTAPALQLVYAVKDEQGMAHHTEVFF